MKNDKMKNQYRVNEQIRVREVRIAGEGGSTVMPTRQALDMAREQGVDLVEISPNAQPPVCRIIDYSKFLYQQKKRAKEMKQKQVKVDIKEIRFGPQTDEHDYQFKLKHAQEFLNEGNKVRAYVFFRGRSILFKEQGEVLLLRFANDLEEYAKVEQLPKLDGKKMFLYLAPKKAGVAKKSQQKVDREKREAEAKEAAQAEREAQAAQSGLLANAKISDEAMKKPQDTQEYVKKREIREMCVTPGICVATYNKQQFKQTKQCQKLRLTPVQRRDSALPEQVRSSVITLTTVTF